MRLIDAFTILAAFLAAYCLRAKFHLIYTLDIFPSFQIAQLKIASIKEYLSFLILIVPIWVIILNFTGAYQSFRTRAFSDIAWITAKSAIYTTFAFGALAFILKIQYISRLLFVIFIFFASIALVIEKWIVIYVMRYIRKKGYNYRRMLIVGSGERAQKFIKLIEAHPEWGFRIAGIIDDEKEKLGSKVMGCDVIGVLEDIPDILHKRAIDEVIFIVPRSWLNKIQNSVATCELEGVKATLAVDLFDLQIAHAEQSDLEGIPLITFETTLGQEGQLFIKRTVDVVFSAIAIILLLPVFPIAAILIKATSKGPVLFVQKRVGRNGRKFILYKFRSMYQGAHKKLEELNGLNEISGPVFKIKNDPRVMPVGRYLRRFSIDELPQLFNVFMGHMSIIGPRPPLPHEVRKYEPWQRRRLSMRPGLTCYWQIYGRNNIGFDKWMKMDLEYIDNWSLWLDFKILVKTIPAVLFGNGAY